MSDHSLIIKLGLDTADSKKRVTEINKELKNLDKQIGQLDTSTDNFEDNMSNMAKKIDLAKTSVTGLSEKLEEQNKQLEKADKRLQNARKELQEYADSGDKSADKMKKLEQKVTSAQSSFNKMQREVGQTERALETANNELAEMEKQLKQMPFEELSKKLNNVGDTLGNISSATTPLSVALAGIGTAGVSAFIDMEGSLVKVKNMLGLTDAEADKLHESARNLASKGFGEFDEVLNTLSNVKLMMGDLIDDSQIEDFSKSVLSIAQTFDVSMNDVLKTSNVLMTNFGINGGEALDIIAWGFQNGLDYSGDFLDTLWEYSVQFADMGYSATEFASMLEKGMQNGIFNTDKLADAVKEANIRLKEMPEATGEAVEKLGLDMTKIQKDIAKGGDTAQKAMTDVAKALLKIEDPVKRNTIGVEIFGTMWEDAGEAIAESVAGATGDIENLDGTMSEMNDNIENMNDGGLAELKVKMTEAFQVIGEKLVPVFSDLVDSVVEAVDWFTDLDSSTQGNIVKFGLLLAGISPVAGGLSTLCGGLSNAVNHFQNMSDSLSGNGGITGGLKNLANVLGGGGGATTGVVGSLGALVGSLSLLVGGGALVVGVGMGIAGLVQGYRNLKEEQERLANYVDENNELMKEATGDFTEHYSVKIKEATEATQPFIDDGLSELKNAFRDLRTNGVADLSTFSEMCETQMTTAMTNAETATDGIISSLQNFNNNTANIEVFTAEDLINIQESHINEIDENVKGAYETLQTTISDQDKIIAGIMETDGVSYEEAYRKWEEQVLIDYGIFCDNLITAQAGLNQDMLNNIGFYYADYTFTNLEELNKAHEQIRKAEEEQNKLAFAQKEQADRDTLALLDTLGEEKVSQLLKFNELEYLAQCEHNNKTEIESHRFAVQQAYAQGIIDEEELQRKLDHYAELEATSDAHLNALTAMEEDYATLPPEIWDNSANAVLTAVEQGKISQEDLTEDLWNNVVEYYENGGDDINEAILQANGNVLDETKKHSTNMNKETEVMQKGMYETIKGYMNRTGATWDEACKAFGLSIEDLGNTVSEETDTMGTDLENASDDGVTAVENLNTGMTPHLTKLAGKLGEMGDDALTMGEDVDSGATDAKNAGNLMSAQLGKALSATEKDFQSASRIVGSETASMVDDIDSVEGKEEDVKVNFFSSGFSTVMSNLRSFVSTVIGAKNAGKSDSDIVAFNYGNNYTEDLYGLKDAGIKTISLAHLDDGISAYATKDSNASDSVSNAVANYNYNNSISTILEPIKDISITPDISTSKDIRNNGALINIENMTVRNDNDIKEIAKQLENYIRLHSKKW